MAETGQYIQDGSVTWVVTDVRNTTLVGSITMYAGTTTPAGYLVCDGSAVSRTDYKTLFDVIGTAYGEGDGDSTFNLPLLTDNRFAEFSSTPAAAKDAGLPNITGDIGTPFRLFYSTKTGAITPYNANYHNFAEQSSAGSYSNFNFDASKSNAIYGNSATVQPRSLTLIPLIRYI